MGSRALEITIISGEGLRLGLNKRVKKNAFVTVGAEHTQILTSTRMDIDGGSYPTWNDKMFVDMPIHSRFLIVEVKCKSKHNGDLRVGSVGIPVTDFVGGFTPANYLHFLSYRLRDHKGEKNGIINLSIRVKAGCEEINSSSKFNYLQPRLAAGPNYKQVEAKTGTSGASNKISEGGINVVTGIPVLQKH